MHCVVGLRHSWWTARTATQGILVPVNLACCILYFYVLSYSLRSLFVLQEAGTLKLEVEDIEKEIAKCEEEMKVVEEAMKDIEKEVAALSDTQAETKVSHAQL